MCTHPFAKKALTLHLARSEGHERYFGCNSMHRKVLASSHQHLMAEAPPTVYEDAGLSGGTLERPTRQVKLVQLLAQHHGFFFLGRILYSQRRITEI